MTHLRWITQIALMVTLLVGARLTGYAKPPFGAPPTPISSCGSLAVGSYALNANLSASGDCLVIGADFVTIDLNGFTITGSRTGAGITDGGNTRVGITVQNGEVTNFATGIDLRHTTGAVVQQVQVLNNVNKGIYLGANGLVQGNLVHGNGSVTNSPDGGISVLENGRVLGNTVTNNTGAGITASLYSALNGNTASNNTNFGLGASAFSTIAHNTANGNVGYGVDTDCPVMILSNDLQSNGSGPVRALSVGFADPCLKSGNIPAP